MVRDYTEGKYIFGVAYMDRAQYVEFEYTEN